MTDYAFLTEIALWAASALVFGAFFMKAILPLRVIAIASNLAFILYAVFAANLPILLLHTALLPLNALRVFQHLKLVRNVRRALENEPHIEKLIPLMDRQTFPAGTTLFNRGDRAETIYLLMDGEVCLPDLNLMVEPETIFGEIGPFLIDKARTASAICQTDCVIYTLSEARVKEVILKEPAFGLFLTRLIAQRMHQNAMALKNSHIKE